jgi:hypothetical protein
MLSDDVKKKALEDFTAMLETVRDGKIKYSESYSYKDLSATVWLTEKAYIKILSLLMEFSDEVAWHGTVSRSDVNEFIIEDILVYPQEVTGSTVVTDQEAYTEWLYGLDDETFNKIRMQGHSHVNMGVSPSGVDDNHRRQILGQLEPDMFYIFQIWNKSLNVHTLFYDMENNILYEDNDVDVKLLLEEGAEEFLTDAKTKVQKRDFSKPIQKSVKVKRRKNKKSEQLDFDGDLEEFGYYPYNEYQGQYKGGLWGI